MATDFYVYVCFRPWDGSPCYVGKGHGKRWSSFPKNRNKKLLAIVAEAGGKIPSVKIRDGLSEAEAFEIEVAFIAAIGRGEDGPLVNATKGGEGTFGITFTNSEETRRKKSIIAANRTYSDETRAKIRLAKTGKTASA